MTVTYVIRHEKLSETESRFQVGLPWVYIASVLDFVRGEWRFWVCNGRGFIMDLVAGVLRWAYTTCFISAKMPMVNFRGRGTMLHGLSLTRYEFSKAQRVRRSCSYGRAVSFGRAVQDLLL